MLKTNKIVSLVLAVVLVVSMFTVALTSTSALADGEIHVVAGAAELCGSAWDPSDTNNQMTWNAEKGIYEKVYYNVAAGSYEFKVTTNYGWDNGDFNTTGDAMYGGPNAVATVTEDGSTVTIGFDGTKALLDITAGSGDVPTPQPSSDDTPVEPGETMTVYFQNNWMWTDICAYWWVGGAEWPGEAAELVGNDGTYDIYAVTVPTTVAGVIFNGNDAGTGSLNQTPDITDAADGNCYYMVWNDEEAKNDVGVENIDVILPSEDDSSEEEPSTDEPSTDEPSTEEPSTEEPSTDGPADPEGLFVRADGVLYPVVKGEKYTYTMTLLPDEKVCSFDASVFYDAEGVKPVYPVDEYGDVDATKLFPVFGAATVYNTGIVGELVFNYSSAAGIRFKEAEKRVVTLDFEVTADEGIYDIYTDFKILAVNDSTNTMVKYRVDSENLVDASKINDAYLFDAEPVDESTDEPSTEEPSTEEPSTEEPSTEEPSTEEPSTEEPSTEEPSTEDTSKGLFVRADGVLYPVIKGEKYTYTMHLLPDEKVCSFDASVFYDTDGVTPVYPVDEYGDVDATKLFPVFGAATVYNTGVPGELIFNYSSAAGVRFKTTEDRVVTLEFEVTADEGIYDIYTDFKILAVNTAANEMIRYRVDGQNLVDVSKINDTYEFDGEFPEPSSTEEPSTEEPSTEEPSTEEPSTEEPSTEEPSTEEPSTEEPSTEAPENFYVAAGSATLFGEPGWSPADRNNELLPNGDGTYSKVYENVAAGTYEFKVTTNGAWDIGDYNLEGDARFGGPNAVAEVLYDGATVTIGFDGTKATLDIVYPQQPSTDEPSTDEPSTDEPSTDVPAKVLQIRIDGEKVFDVVQGQVYTYTYSLACDKKICSLDCATMYDADGLEFLPKVDEYGDFTGEEYPNINTVFNHGLVGQIIYNYSNVSGNRFPVADPMTEKNIVFQGEFKVTAEEGIYDIYTDLKVLGDNNNNKIIFGSEVVDDTVVVVEAATLDGEFAPEPSTDEPSTDEPSTDEPSTDEPSTDEPSTDEPSTDEPSTDEPSTDEPSTDEPSTDEPSTDEPSTDEPSTDEPSTDEPSSDDATVPAPASPDQSSTDDEKANGNNNNAVKTGATSAAIALFTVLVMAAGLVMFSRKRSNG